MTNFQQAIDQDLQNGATVALRQLEKQQYEGKEKLAKKEVISAISTLFIAILYILFAVGTFFYFLLTIK